MANIKKVIENKSLTIPNASILKPVCGAELTAPQYKAFSTWYKKGNIASAAKAAGVEEEEVYLWVSTDWWIKLKEFFFQLQRDSFHAKLLSAEKDIFKAMMKVVKGTHSDAKTATAIISAVKMFTESGEDPIVSRKRGPTGKEGTTVNNQYNFGDVDIKKLSLLSPEALMEITVNGAPVPEGIVKK